MTREEIKEMEKQIHEEQMKKYPQPIRDMLEHKTTLNQCRVAMGFKPIEGGKECIKAILN